MVIISLHHFHLLLMSNANNQYERTGLDELLDSIVDIYANENRHQPQRQQTNRYPLSFNIQPPRTTPTPTPTPAPTPRPTMNTNEQFSNYISVIHALRDISTQYNNNIRDYNTNIRQILQMVGDIRGDIHLRGSRNDHTREPTIPRPSSSRFAYDPTLLQERTTQRLPRQSPPTRSPIETSNYIDILLQSMPFTTTSMENVIVRPSPEQITNATRPIIYHSDNTRILSHNCPITLEPFEEQQLLTQITYCGHVFSQEGINRWFEGNVRCPICRYDIRNYNARCRTCRRTLQEYGTRCTYCEESASMRASEEEPDEGENSDNEPYIHNIDETDETDETDEIEDVSMNPFQIIMNYEIRRTDMSFNTQL